MKLFGKEFGGKKKKVKEEPSKSDGNISFGTDRIDMEEKKVKPSKGSGGGILSLLTLCIGFGGGVFLTAAMPDVVEDITGLAIEGRHVVQAAPVVQQNKVVSTQPRRQRAQASESTSVLPIDPSLADYKTAPFFDDPDFKKIANNFGPKTGEGLEVFLSFSCRYCPAGWQMAKDFALDNPGVPVKIHMIATKTDVPYVAAYFLLAQKNRELGNDFLDFIFSGDIAKGKYAELLMAFAQTKKFNPKEIFDYWDKNREELRLLLRENVLLSKKYNVPGTPSFVAHGKFLNGEITLSSLTEAWKNPQSSPLLQEPEPVEQTSPPPAVVPAP